MSDERIGAWVIERELGRGANGAVFRARHPRLGLAAVKVVLDGFALDADSAQRFEREALALARLDHPGVVRLLDHGQTPRGRYLAMELVAGESLHEVVTRGGPLAPAHAARLVEQLARACDHVHRAGLIHRDVKPHNVLVTRDGSARLVDFGLVRSLDPAAPSLTASGALVGTPAFMAPEQVHGTADPRSDLYALGATLYFALTGEPPFRGDNAVAVLRALVEEQPERPSRLRPGVPARLEATCLRCLRKDPAERHPSAAALARDLARAARGADPGGRRLLPRAAASAAALLVVGAAALAGWRARSADGPVAAPVAQPAPVSTTPAPATEPAPTTEASVATESPAATEASVATESPAATWVQRGRARLDAGDWQGAIAAFDRAVAEDPRDAQAVGRRGGARLAGGDLPGAIEDFTRAIELDPRYAWAHVHRGIARSSLGDPRAALADHDRAIELDPEYGLAYTNRGGVRQALGDLEGARRDLERAVALRPDDAGSRTNLGFLRLALGDPAGARADLERALAIAPAYVPALINRAEARIRLGDLDGALADAQRAIDLEPRNPQTWIERGIVHVHRREAAAAEADWTHAIELDPRLPDGYSRRGTLRLMLGDHGRAVVDLERALELGSSRPEDHLHLGAARLRGGDAAGAERALLRSLEVLTDPTQRAQAQRELDEARRRLR